MRAEEAEKKLTKRIDVARAPAPLEEYVKHFDALFGKSNQRDGFRRYVEGLLLPSERHKMLTGLANTEPVVGAQLPRAQALQWFLSEADWDERKMQESRLQLLRENPTTAPTSKGVLVIDETGDRKDGDKTAHVGRQYLGKLGKIDNGVVSVTSLWADEEVYYPVDFEPYTPAHYFEKGEDDPAFRTKLKIALELVDWAHSQGIPFRAVVADNFYGEDRTLRQGFRALKLGYVLALKPSHDWWHRVGTPGSLQEVAQAAGWKNAEQLGKSGTHHQDVSRRQHTGLVGAGDRGRAVWARQNGTGCGGNHRSTDGARSHHLVSGNEPACSYIVPGDRTPVGRGLPGRGDQAVWAAYVG